MRIKEALKEASSLIPLKEAKIILSSLLEVDKLWLIMHEDESIKNEKLFFEMVQYVKNNHPVEYITKSVNFFSREFYIDYGALIPRPETEILVEKALALIEDKKITKIAEIGTGSGIISTILSLKSKDIKITATDISTDALKIAKTNAKKFNVLDKIEFVNCSFLDGIDEDFQMIISNPPYIKNSFQLEKKLSYEPDIALFGGEKGDEIIKQIIELAIERNIKYLCCEMGYDQKESIKEYFKSKQINNVEFYKDLAGFDRGFIAKVC
ncbi:MAG: peptide chain release factor N(5)-glutamine methyltransferase [Sulfurospirillum sp.]|nr:MAG: peptide chain release factor N(5)-glutamine methyltransferase [Sulfurospirillum sp.]